MASLANNYDQNVKKLEQCKITPPIDSAESPAATEFSLPLTFFDIYWLKFPPPENIFFFQLAESSPVVFNTTILPKLKHSLSLTLCHFLPVAGSLNWHPQASEPTLLYTPGDGVSLTVAESSANFNHLTTNKPRDAIQSRSYIPEFLVSDRVAPIITIQITLFPNQGFSICCIVHHAVLDARSVHMFLKAWAHISQQLDSCLPPEMTPSFDREVIKDPEGVYMCALNNWLEIDPIKGLKLLLPKETTSLTDSVRAEFELSRQDIERIRARLIKHQDQGAKYLSSFVVIISYTLDCLVRAKRMKPQDRVNVFVPADCRDHGGDFDPLVIPNAYFGNCVAMCKVDVGVGEVVMEGSNGVAFLAEKVSESIEVFRRGKARGVYEGIKNNCPTLSTGILKVGVVGSPRLEFYGVDFGWGKPEKVEISSIDRTGAISMLKSKDGSGGVEIGLVLKKEEMDLFHSFFNNGCRIAKI